MTDERYALLIDVLWVALPIATAFGVGLLLVIDYAEPRYWHFKDAEGPSPPHYPLTWGLASSEAELHYLLGGRTATIDAPAKPLVVRLARVFALPRVVEVEPGESAVLTTEARR